MYVCPYGKASLPYGGAPLLLAMTLLLLYIRCPPFQELGLFPSKLRLVSSKYGPIWSQEPVGLYGCVHDLILLKEIRKDRVLTSLQYL